MVRLHANFDELAARELEGIVHSGDDMRIPVLVGPVGALAAVVAVLALSTVFAFRQAAVAREAKERAEEAKERADGASAAAREAKDQAEREKDRAQRGEELAKEQKDRAERLLYLGQIALAHRAWEDNDPVGAKHYLRISLKKFRGWEILK